MKPLQLTSLLFLTPILAPPAMAQLFIRPSFMYVSYQNSGYSNKTGFGVTAGTTFGTRAEHELGLEIGTMDWALSQDVNVGGSFVFTTNGSGQFIPCLASYRYRLSAKDARVRYYLGLSLGFANSRGDLTQYRSGVVAHTGFSQWSAAYGGTVGVTLSLTEAMELDVGYRYLHIASVDPGSGMNRIPMEATNANVLQIALGFRF